MTFNFSKIKNLKENMIFNLFLKYDINDTNALQFVKEYLKVNIIEDNSVCVKATKLFPIDAIPIVLEKLQEDKDCYYYKKMEVVVNKTSLKDILLQNRGNLVKALDGFDKLEKKMEEVVYITPRGVVRMMENDCTNFMSPDLKTLFYNVLLLCVYEIDMKDTEDKRVVV